MAGKKTNTNSKNKSEERVSKPPVKIPYFITLGDIPSSKSSQPETTQVKIVDLTNIKLLTIQKTQYFENMSLYLLNLELKLTGKSFHPSYQAIQEKEIDEENNTIIVLNFDEQKCEKKIDENFARISKLLPVFNSSSDKSFELVIRCCDHMHSSYFLLQSLSKFSSDKFIELLILDQKVIACIYQLIGYYYGKELISGQDMKKFHILRTSKSTITKRRKHENHKGCVKTSAIKMFNQFTLSTVKNNISEAAFVNMIKDDLSPLKMSEKKIKNLLHELQDEGQIKFDPRKAKSGKMIHFSNNEKDVT